MGQSVEVVVSEMSSAAARLEDAAQRLQDGLSSVSDEIIQLLGSAWKGSAASAYGPAWEQWYSGARQIVAGLQRMSELLTIAGNEYAKTDESAADGLGSTMEGPSGPTGGWAAGLGDLGLGGTRTAGGAGPTTQSADVARQTMSSVPDDDEKRDDERERAGAASDARTAVTAPSENAPGSGADATCLVQRPRD